MSISTYTLEKLVVITRGGVEIDLSAAFVDFTLYESIFEHFMTGHISLVDTFDLQSKFDLVGDEAVEIVFYTAGHESSPITFRGKIYKIDQRAKVTEHAQAYIIYICSNEMIKNARKHVQRAYEDTRTSIVQAIYDTHLKASSKSLRTIASKGIAEYCFGAVRPTEAISCVIKNANSSTNDRGFLFFENNESFCCYPLEFMYRQPVQKYFEYSPVNVYQDVKNKDGESFIRIQDLELLEENSLVDKIVDGQLGSKHMFFNFETKAIQEIKYNSDMFYNSSKSLAQKVSKADLNNPEFEDVATIGFNTDTITINTDLIVSRFKKQEVYKVHYPIFVFGDSSLKAGMVCEAQLPKLVTDIESHKDYVTGKFLITSIKHTCNNVSYYQDIMIQKDAYEAL